MIALIQSPLSSVGHRILEAWNFSLNALRLSLFLKDRNIQNFKLLKIILSYVFRILKLYLFYLKSRIGIINFWRVLFIISYWKTQNKFKFFYSLVTFISCKIISVSYIGRMTIISVALQFEHKIAVLFKVSILSMIRLKVVG